jgi:hypothetical protein
VARHYTPNGRPNGGRREGAGRPKGTSNPLPLGAVSAIKAMKRWHPEAVNPEAAPDGDRAFQRIRDVMEERVGEEMASPVLNAAKTVLERACGPVTQKHEHSGGVVIELATSFGEAADAAPPAVPVRASPPRLGNGAASSSRGDDE